MISVDAFSDMPVYQQIVEQVRLGVAKGQYAPGERLEPVRELATRLGVNPSTVARAYQLLERDGIIRTNRRRGSVITRKGEDGALEAMREGRLRGIVERSVVEALAHGFGPDEVEAAFELQLASWRERRQWKPPAVSPAIEAGPSLRFAGSHDLALEALWAQARRTRAELGLTVSYVGSLDGLLALLHGEADLAGAHILDEETGEYNVPILRRLFFGRELCLVTVAEREQGLMVPPGNPLRVQQWTDLARPQLRFINRQPGSGTRMLLDFHLRRAHIAPGDVSGYESVAPTHWAVAMAVADGLADVGLGLRAAARARGLDFVPLARERYDLVLLGSDAERLSISWVLQVLRSTAFRQIVAQMGGYETQHTGELVCV